MLKEFLDRSKNTPLPDSADYERHEELIYDAFDSMTAFLRDPATFPDSYINQLMSSAFPENGRSPFRLEIAGLDSGDRFEFYIDPQSEHPRDEATVRMSDEILTEYRRDPIGVLCQLVSVASVGSDLRHYKLPLGEQGPEINLNAQFRTEAYIAQLLHRLNELARNEKYTLVIDKGDKAMMQVYPYGILSLPPEMRPFIIPDLIRVPFPEAN